MKEIIIVMMTAVLADNIILIKALGICPFLKTKKGGSRSFRIGLAVMLSMVALTAVTWPIERYILEKFDIEYLRIIPFILIAFGLGYGISVLIRKVSPEFYETLGCFTQMITLNCVVMGVALIAISENYSYIQSLLTASAYGIGFIIAMVMFAGIQGALEESENVPESFKGIPISLVAACLMSLAFMGFSGVAMGMLV